MSLCDADKVCTRDRKFPVVHLDRQQVEATGTALSSPRVPFSVLSFPSALITRVVAATTRIAPCSLHDYTRQKGRRSQGRACAQNESKRGLVLGFEVRCFAALLRFSCLTACDIKCSHSIVAM